MYKIYDCGIKGNLFIITNSYLENRKPRNLVNNFTSDWFYTTKGLSQGSISSILFLIFTGDLSADPRASNSIIDRLISHSSTRKSFNTSNVNSAKPQAGLSSSKEKMCDNELFPKDSLSLMSPEGLPQHCTSAEGPQKFSKLTPPDCWKIIFPEHSQFTY